MSLKIPPLLAGAGGLVLLGGAGIFGYKYYSDWKKKKQAENILKLQKVSNVTGMNQLGKVSKVNLVVISQDIYDSFHSSIDEDEARALRAFKNTPVLKISQLSEVYQKIYALNLLDDFRKYLSDTDFIKVKYYFR